MSAAGRPFGEHSISLGLHPLSSEDAAAQADQLVEQGRTADAGGFDGVTLSEHHAGFPGYMPQPLLAANWILAATERVWAGPNPILVGLRPMPLLAEELAWTAARFPVRVGATLVAGYARSDFDAVGASYDDRLQRLPSQLQSLLDSLAPNGRLAGDPAVAAYSAHRFLQLGVNSENAACRAASLGMGVVFPGGEEGSRLGRLARAYRTAGGDGVVMCIVNAWLGDPPAPDQPAQGSVFQRSASPGMRQAAGFRQGPFVGCVEDVTHGIVEYLQAASATAVNLRFNAAGATAAEVLEQIERVSIELLPGIRRHFASLDRAVT